MGQQFYCVDTRVEQKSGTDREGNALLVVSTSQVQECSYENLVSLLALLSDTLPQSTLFTVLLDTRHIHLKQLKFYLRACQQALYKRVRQVLIIQPEKFLEQQKINFDLIVSGYTLKTVLISMHKLSKFVNVNQLPEQFGGTLGYDPDEWLDNRIEIKKWQNYMTEAEADKAKHNPEEDQKLEEFISKLQSTKRVEDEFAANTLKKSIKEVKIKEEENSKDGLIKDHTAGVSDFLDWIEGSGEKWLNSLCQRGLGSAEIARRLQISSSTVRNVVAAIKKRGDASEVKKSGRPRSVNTRNTRAIIKKRIIRNDGLSLNRMASQLGIARSTVQSIVKNDLKLKSYKLRRGQYLSDKSKAMRLEKCRKLLQHFQVRRVSDVIWTDEKIFTIEPLPNRQNQRQLLSKDDSMSPKRRLAHNRLFPKSVMVWAGITATGKTPLVFIERNVKINSEVYQKIVLMDNLLPWVTQHFAGGPFILQQDWAPSHGSRSTLAVLEAHFPGFLDKNLWPASSPDLNPMDFSVWGMLEGKIAGKVFATVDDLKAALEVAWASIDDGYLRRTVNSIADNVDEAESLVKQHEELTTKTREIEEQSQQLAEMATRLMAACPQVAIVLQKTREQIRDVAEHFAYRVEAQTQFALSNRNFRAKVAEFSKKSDLMLEKVCAEDDNSAKTLEELTKNKKELEDSLNSMNVAFEAAMDAGEETVVKTRQYGEVLPCEEFIAHIGSSLSYISQRQNRHNELASVKRLEQQQQVQLLTTYGDCDQAIKWLAELKETLHKDYSLSDVNEEAVRHLRNDRQNLDRTALSTYQYGKQLLSMAKNTERAAMKESSSDERHEKLESAWRELDEAIRQNEARLKVVESFMVTHRQMMERVSEIDKSLRERLRVSGRLNSITLSTERRRLKDDIEELSSIGRMLSAQINADHSTTPEDRQSAMKQIADKIEQVKSAERRMESLIGEEEEATSSSSGKEDKPSSTRRVRPLSKVPEEEGGEVSPVLPRAVRLLESTEGITPAIRLSKNESYL
uniref:CRAL-TRIO domain-containing protein n=1 Tax=Caenorhabditis japonica TaxID=281687 RepID=A0A8R1HNY4_CAEJA